LDQIGLHYKAYAFVLYWMAKYFWLLCEYFIIIYILIFYFTLDFLEKSIQDNPNVEKDGNSTSRNLGPSVIIMVATFRIKGTENVCGNFGEETFFKSAT